MPSWKKVIVSGSNAALNSLTVTNGVTGSLLGTASYSSNSDQLDGLHATSFVLNSQTSSMTVSAASTSTSASYATVASSSLFATNASSSLRAVSSSFATLAASATTATSATSATSASFATNAQNVLGTITNANTASNITPAINGNVNNRVLTADGDGTLTGEANLTFNGNKLIVVGKLENGDSGCSATGTESHAEGRDSEANGDWSHTEGYQTLAVEDHSHAEGYQTHANGVASHAEGYQTSASAAYSHAEGQETIASGSHSHAEGKATLAKGSVSHAEGYESISSGSYSHAEGNGSLAQGIYSHAEGSNTVASGNSSHTEGQETIASGSWSHAEGYQTRSSGSWSHAEGYQTITSGYGSHAEGLTTYAVGHYSHAEGENTFAGGIASHAAGLYTSASGHYQSVIGIANQPSTNQGAFIIGNGPDDASSRSNLLYASGSIVEITGSLYVSRSDNPQKSSIFTSPGTKTEPAYTFIGDEDTGMYNHAANTVALTGGGETRVLVSDTELYLIPGTTSAQANILMASNDSIPLISKTAVSSITVGAATDATNATNLNVLNSTTNASYPFVFSTTTTAGNKPLYTDTATTCYINPSTNVIGATTFIGALTGNASTATTASFATNAQNVLGTVTNATSASRAISSSFATLAASATNATNVTNIGVTDAGADTTTWVLLAGSQTGTQGARSDAGLTYNASTNALTATTFIGALTGTATEAGIAGKTIQEDTEGTGTYYMIMTPTAVGGDGRSYNTSNQTDPISYNAATTTLISKFFDGSLNGNASTATTATNVNATANNSTNETTYLTFVDGATGVQGIETDTALNYNPSTNILTAGTFAGALSGNASTATTASFATLAASASFLNPLNQQTLSLSQTGTGVTMSMNALSAGGCQIQFNPNSTGGSSRINVANGNSSLEFQISSATKATITTGGAMGLGVTPTNTAGRFEASNDIVAYSTSDKRWKNNIVKIDSPLEKISQISGVEFDWIEDEPLHGNKGHDVGVIAQEIELVIPEAVQTRESGMKAVQYDKIIPLLIESIKEQQKQIEDLKELVNKLTK